MKTKKIFQQLNIVAQCRKYGLTLWQCPQFLFLIMGLVIIVSTLLFYLIGTRYIEDPAQVALITILIAIILLVIAGIINRSFERMAEASRLKTEFISVVSHQLRSPLSNLKWVIEILASGKVNSISENQLEYIKILKENSQRMMDLVSDLLQVSKIEKNLHFKKEEILLEDLVKKSILEFQPFAQASNVQIKFEIEKDLPKVFTDPLQIKQTIENLLDNAIRYVKEKGQVEIKLQKKGRNLYFEIKDNGVGIPKEDQKYIFQKFFRSENVLKYQTQGSGLGLYIAKSIIGKAGGKIGFKSQEGKGSTFWFTLPLR